MARAVAQPVAMQDLALAAGGLLVAGVTLAFALSSSEEPRAAIRPIVARVEAATGAPKLRPSATLLWRGLSAGTDVHDGDSVFVPPGAEATLRFIDGTELSVDERSLVVVEPPRGGHRAVTLRQGSLSGRAGDTGLVLSTPAGEARLDARSEARVELTGSDLEVAVKKGAAQVKPSRGGEVKVSSGQRATADPGGARALAAWPVTLTAPEAHLRRFFHGVPAALELTWRGAVPDGARVQVARDRLFAFVEHDAPAAEGRWVLEAPRPGVSWWRVVDDAGRPVSEARRFSLVEDVAPATMFPREGEVVLAPKGSQVAFSWTSLPGVTSFLVELSPSREFEPITVSEAAKGNTARLTLSLEEGTWYWRVRASREGGEPGAPSEPSRFRLIHKGIPEAPELLTPQIEVTP
ncbi:MAG: FecR domain-containing protein [Myxococcota bacterium]